MLQERVSENVFVFTSNLYVQVTGGVVVTDKGTIIIDSLPFPEESKELRDFALERGEVRYIINTHIHADHIYGNYLFPNAEIVTHQLCRDSLLRVGQTSLDEAKTQTSGLAEVELRIPTITFEEELRLFLGDTAIRLLHTPGHTVDSIVAHVESERVLFAGDTVMALPYIAGGSIHLLVNSLMKIRELGVENLVQGHGDVLLRGEVPNKLDRSINYLRRIYTEVYKRVRKDAPEDSLQEITMEKCGSSPMILDGAAQQFHQANLQFLYQTLKKEMDK